MQMSYQPCSASGSRTLQHSIQNGTSQGFDGLAQLFVKQLNMRCQKIKLIGVLMYFCTLLKYRLHPITMECTVKKDPELMDMSIAHHLCLLHVAKLFKRNIYLYMEKDPFCMETPPGLLPLRADYLCHSIHRSLLNLSLIHI